jgi:hypothetical protein
MKKLKTILKIIEKIISKLVQILLLSPQQWLEQNFWVISKATMEGLSLVVVCKRMEQELKD